MELVIQVKEIDKSIIQQVERKAKQQNVGLSEFVLNLIRSGLQTLQTRPLAYHDLDHLAGTWSDDDVKIFEQATSDFGQINEALWV